MPTTTYYYVHAGTDYSTDCSTQKYTNKWVKADDCVPKDELKNELKIDADSSLITTKRKATTKRNKKESDLDLNAEYDKLKGWEVIKLLKSIDKPKDNVDTPIIILSSEEKYKQILAAERIAISNTHPSVKSIHPFVDSDNDISKMRSDINSGMIVPSHNCTLIDTLIILIDVFNKNQSVMEQSNIIKLISGINSYIEKFIQLHFNKIKVNTKTNIFVINESINIDELEEPSMLAGVLEMEEVRDDDFSYIKLTF